ncbi:hypothetical protein DFH06DRAFT_1135975 [Mycena polygramma]|nr:hypothetical protein DFH06DRAFT_1135975 [Mycena polygramma]
MGVAGHLFRIRRVKTRRKWRRTGREQQTTGIAQHWSVVVESKRGGVTASHRRDLYPLRTTHVSDSEPEREAARSHPPACQTRTRTTRRPIHRPRRTPLSNHTNTHTSYQTPTFGLEARLVHIEKEIGDLSAQLRAAKKVPATPSPPSSPISRHERAMEDKCVGADIPIGAVDCPLVPLSDFDDAVLEEVGKQLSGLHRQLAEFEQLVERDESRKRKLLLESFPNRS